MAEILIRRASPSDLEALRGFEQGIIAAERPYDPTIRKGRVTYYDLSALIESPDAFVAVAESNGIALGCGFARRAAARVYTQPPHYAYVGLMYVAPEWRGRGVSKAILSALKEWALAEGLTEMRLDVYPTNLAAVRAYEKFGFDAHMLEMRLPFEPR